MKTFTTSLALLFFSIIGLSQSSEYAKLDSLFMILETNDRFFGSVAVSHNGKIIYDKTIGYADIETKLPNTSETKFRIGSVTKTFTATLIMQAVEKGEISLDDTIEEYFPQIQNADKITIRYLLNHRSGITNFTDRSFLSWYTKPISRSALLDTIVKKGIDFEPDTKHRYSNSNYVLLTFILEDIFEKSYTQILEQFICKPLNLVNTSYGNKIDPALNEARSYRMKTDWTLEPEGNMSIPLGAGGILSTPTELCHFAEALFEGRLISTESLEQMKPAGDASYGFGLEGISFESMKGIGHPGVIDAFTSTMAYFEESNLSFAICSNGSNYGSHDIAIAVLSEVFGKPYALPNFESVEMTSEELDQYLGTYETDELPMDMIISKEGNTLLLEIVGQAATPVLAQGDHIFAILKYGVKMTFTPSKKKMRFEQNGLKFELTLKQSVQTDASTSIDFTPYLGTYESDELPMDLTIKKKGNQLIAQGTGQPSFSLTFEGDHIFKSKEIGLKIIFNPYTNKMKFVQGGAKFEMTKKQALMSDESTIENLDQYLGIYTSDQLPIDLTISKDGNQLIAQGTGQPSFPLVTEGDHIFSYKEIGLTITFIPTEMKLLFEQGGQKIEMIIEK